MSNEGYYQRYTRYVPHSYAIDFMFYVSVWYHVSCVNVRKSYVGVLFSERLPAPDRVVVI